MIFYLLGTSITQNNETVLAIPFREEGIQNPKKNKNHRNRAYKNFISFKKIKNYLKVNILK